MTLNSDKQPSLLLRLVIGGIFLALALGTAVSFLTVFSPPPPPEYAPPFKGYDRTAMIQAVAPENVARWHARIVANGNRFPGYEGLHKTEAMIAQAFADAGLDIIEVPQSSIAPTTFRRDILDLDGKPLDQVEIYPFFPNHFQPIVTPDEGITAKLLNVTDDILLERTSFDDCIAVIDARNAPKNYGVSWIPYARLGFEAVILTNAEGLMDLDWTTVTPMNSDAPVNFTRLAATPNILDRNGETVTLHVRCGWKRVESRALVGVMRSRNSTASEALLVTSCYDACSVLPDHSPGEAEAYSLAEQLALLDGLQTYRNDLRRDVVFISYCSQMMGQFNADRFTAILGPAVNPTEARRRITEKRSANAKSIEAVTACLDLIRQHPMEGEETRRLADALKSLDATAEKLLKNQVTFTLNTIVAELSENVLQRHLDFIRIGEDTASVEFATYATTKRRYDLALSVAGFPLDKIVHEKQDYMQEHNFRNRLVDRLVELERHHQRQSAVLDAELSVNELLRSYRQLVVLTPYLLPADKALQRPESLSFTMGSGIEYQRYLQTPIFQNIIERTIQSMEETDRPTVTSMQNKSHSDWTIHQQAPLPMTDVAMWNAKGYPGMALVNTDRFKAYQQIGTPFQRPYIHDVQSMATSLQLMGRMTLSLAFGNFAFEAPTLPSHNRYSGTVYMGNIGKSMVPNHPYKHALFAHKGATDNYGARGFYTHPIFETDVYGAYDLEYCNAQIQPRAVPGYSPEVAGFDENWRITQIKDTGNGGQNIYQSILLGRTENVNLVTFRAAPTTILDMINPQTLKQFNSAEFITLKSLESFGKFNVFNTADGIVTAFLRPDGKFMVKMRAGAPDNEKLQQTRAFMLGIEPGYEGNPEKEIDGPGYLTADTELIRNTAREVAYSVHSVNDQRIKLQDRYDMVDERTHEFHDESKMLIEQSLQPNRAKHLTLLDQRDAATYDILNHPVLRESITEAVVGILWYLGLLVPFVFFFEKLVFAFPDIRKQLGAQAVIFLIVFALLRILHPAFEMIRSSFMILLGFIIMLISGGITLLFSGKFQENLEGLRQKRGQVTTAEANTMGVIGTAFSLGLNNMHRRAVRTGLTCATLVLITFAMICFTSVQSNLVDTTTAVGKASYQGMLIKNDKARPLTNAEHTALQTKYSHVFNVMHRQMITGTTGWDLITRNPDFKITYAQGENELSREFASVVGLSAEDPLTNKFDMRTTRPWPNVEQVRQTVDALNAVMIPTALAQKIRVTPEQVDNEIVIATINGTDAWIAGIFDGDSLNSLTDLDGHSILPPDVEALDTIELSPDWHILADETAPRFDGNTVIISVNNASYSAQNSRIRIASIAVVMPASLTYKQARQEINRYLEQSGRATFYGLDGVAYRGQRTRETSLAGVVELLIPLIIAAMTVLNTMKGSVYERRNEIFVYNAVGIAPRYIFAMFFSEAFVYAVVGSVLGYILSQGTGRILTMLGMTGGLNMTFTSITTIYASLAIMAAVFLSTLFPARSAMQIAAPAEESGWTLPEPDGDNMRFILPFTFNYDGRIAILAFFHRYFEDHGEGGAGKFFSGQPDFCIAIPENADADYVPQLETTVWLKPFDLGVSQKVTISMPTDPETGEYIATVNLERLSGTRESWIRLNHPFILLLRKHFLYWRAVTPQQREELFTEARDALRNLASTQESLNG